MITTWSQGAADEGMPEQLLVETLHKVRLHPWWIGRAQLALAVLQQNGVAAPAPVLDVGCGWGVNLDSLEEAGYEATGLDISRQILQLIDQPKRRLIEADLTKALPVGEHSHRGLLLLDVIEHLDDDQGTLARIAPLLQPGGVLVVSVPALPELFSDYDAIQGHRRRYVPETLRAAFDGTGFAVDKIFWWGAWMVPVLKRMRLKEKSNPTSANRTYADYLRLPPWPAPVLMKLLYAWEKGRALKGRLRTGTSLFAVARRSPDKA